MTHTLQHNMVTTAEDNTANKRWKFNKRFVWNHFLIKRLKKFTHTDEWTLPCIHGYFKQCSESSLLFFFLLSCLSTCSTRIFGFRSYAQYHLDRSAFALFCRHSILEERGYRRRARCQRRRIRADCPRGIFGESQLSQFLFVRANPRIHPALLGPRECPHGPKAANNQ